jgi:hypothetical protein
MFDDYHGQAINDLKGPVRELYNQIVEIEKGKPGQLSGSDTGRS